jgi:hypothetical protein
MTILNQASDGLPNVLVVLYDVLARSTKPVPRDDLLETVAPAGVAHEDGKLARLTMTRWTELGLFVQGDAGCELATRPTGRIGSEAELLLQVRRSARACALDASNNEDFWASEGARAADFTRAMAWVLAQDVYRATYGGLEDDEKAQMVDGTAALMQNDTRRKGLKSWGQFLGFLRPAPRGQMEIDPTPAVRDVLHDVLPKGDGMPVRGFVEQLAAVLPVLDGGTWRRNVLERIRPNVLMELSEGQLSTSLSRALLNLMRNEEIVMENRADTGSGILLTGRDGPRTDLRFTWVRLANRGKGR